MYMQISISNSSVNLVLEICNVSTMLLLASRDVRQTCHAMPLRRASDFSATTATPLAPPIMTVTEGV